ncbi:MAG: glycosyltransferase, partial [Opitutales bacterium]
MSRFTICCGGTGGHLAPGIAVAQRLVAAGHEPTLVVSRKQVDARLTERYPELKTISAPGEGWTGRPVQLPGFAFGQARLLAFALRHLRQSGSEGVLAFGGFLTGGFALAARVLGLPLVVHEANQIPGRSIRRAARWADTIWLPPGASDSGIVSERVRRCGMPLREEFQPMATEEARRRLSLPEQGPLLLVAGGSQGARALNEWADAQRQVLADAGVHCLCL